MKFEELKDEGMAHHAPPVAEAGGERVVDFTNPGKGY